MSRQTQGKDYEHTLGREICRATNKALIPVPAGYSGNHSYDEDEEYTFAPPDLFIDDGEMVHAFELRNTSADAVTFNYEPDDRQKDDIYGLVEYARLNPRPTAPKVGVRFNNRQLILAKLWVEDADDPEALLENAAKMCPVEASRTWANNLRIQKPDTSDYPSATKGSDVDHVLDTIGFDL